MDESCSEDEQKPRAANKSSAVRSRFGKLAQMSDESTQQFKREEKEAERKKQVQAMQSMAKSHFLLVEKHRNRFR